MAKAAGTIQASTSVAAGATQTSSAFNMTTFQGPSVVTMRITNGATGPTVKCTASLETSGDGSTNWRPFFSFAGDTVNSSVTDSGLIEISPAVMYVRSVFTGHTAQAVTVEALIQSQTS